MGLCDVLFRRLHLLAVGDLGHFGEQGVDVESRVPDVEVPHRRELPHRLAVFADGAEDGGAGLLGGEFAIAPGDLEARREALQVPLPGPGKGLVEVVDVQDQAPIGGGEDAEVGEVGIAACLNPQPGFGGLREVHRHDRRGAAKEGEGRGQHPPVADRHELGDAALGLALEQLDRIFAGPSPAPTRRGWSEATSRAPPCRRPRSQLPRHRCPQCWDVVGAGGMSHCVSVRREVCPLSRSCHLRRAKSRQGGLPLRQCRRRR